MTRTARIDQRPTLRRLTALAGIVLAVAVFANVSAASADEQADHRLSHERSSAVRLAQAAPEKNLPTQRPVAESGPTTLPQPIPVDRVHLPRDLSPWGMFAAADFVVQSVMVGLVLASIAVWTVWLAKLVELWLGRRALQSGLAEIRDRRSLAEAEANLGDRRRLTLAFLYTARSELALAETISQAAGIKERVASRLAEIEAAAARAMRGGMGLMASVGATAPFVGLFGTVWGIMNSFIGISKAQTTNLAIVAPGIAEALLATAMGLVAAIPAVILYNQLSRSIAGYRALLRENAAEVERILSRELDRHLDTGARPRARAAE
jgi:biopolymer transport protein ExbB